MVVQRRHAENPLAARLERRDLQDDGECLTDEDNTHDGQQCLRPRENRYACERTAESK